MLLGKYRRIEELTLESYYLNKIHSQIPIHIIVELETKHKQSKVRREIHQLALSKYATKLLSIHDLVSFNGELLQLIHRFNLSKTKFYKQVVDGVYFEHVAEAIKNNFAKLPQTTKAYYGKNLIFVCFPKFGNIE